MGILFVQLMEKATIIYTFYVAHATKLKLMKVLRSQNKLHLDTISLGMKKPIMSRTAASI